MSFHEVRLPDDIERGAQGGPEFNTSIAQLSSGFEQRNGNWSRARLSWDLGYGIQDQAGYQEVISFFYARRGRLFGFRFKDWSDFTGTAEQIGTGDGSQTQFQLQKTYSDAGGSYTRFIQKPVGGTVLVTVDNVPDNTAVVDTATGVVTPTSVPGNGQIVRATYEFDVPVRFQNDTIETNLEYFGAGAVPNIPVQEVLLQLASLA